MDLPSAFKENKLQDKQTKFQMDGWIKIGKILLGINWNHKGHINLREKSVFSMRLRCKNPWIKYKEFENCMEIGEGTTHTFQEIGEAELFKLLKVSLMFILICGLKITCERVCVIM